MTDVDPCTCTMLAAQTWQEPSEWEQDPWCQTHPDVPFIVAEARAARCNHCGKVGCDYIANIHKARAEAAEAALLDARAEVGRLAESYAAASYRISELHVDLNSSRAEVGRLSAERAASEARVREALVSLATVTDDEYATVVARHVESLLTLDLQTSGGEVQPEACPTVSGASPSEPDDPHGACSRNLVAVAVERDKALGAAKRAATKSTVDHRERIAQAIDQAWAEASDSWARRMQPRTAYSVAYGDGYLDGLEHAEGIARSTPLDGDAA